MKQAQLPIPTGWKLLLNELYQRVHKQVTSPWTKLVVLACLTLLFTQREFSFNVSIGGGDGWLSVKETSVFNNSAGGPTISGGAAGAEAVTEAKLTGYVAPAKEWTARQKKQLAYVDRFKLVALAEMETHGIPASITLAQGLLESGTGRSTLARKNNNHFGIKCFSKKCRKGHCSNHSDDHHKDFFRNFETPEESYREHSKVLMKSRYKSLFTLAKTDYKNWSHGLRKAGYATDPRYGDKLVRMIEDLELWRYDRL
ncbi:mannosyl-glycoprotein endo-beta-N-acetylglucosamidase [Neolewinella aurantiaca]|uniref:Mannosyl-glycoprotein endo-beta-N-acetylglucosamidase n=1 Tax=Neolewinella aurantiaca TaxID=2602767 RepID=A0A5C7FP60_9BACT|nr:glucosaminidase domain-containing protein [Neolewinella aurantiaca]TXF87689.1 mannosyl-glycoprotein endo-beta-N-acetylglucosamidase [Neolewinella aurantiaca]